MLEVIWIDRKAEHMYNRGSEGKDLTSPIVKGLVKVVNFMKECKSSNDLYVMTSLHIEKLKEKKYRGKMSARINNSRRLIFSLSSKGTVQVVAIEELNNHYG